MYDSTNSKRSVGLLRQCLFLFRIGVVMPEWFIMMPLANLSQLKTLQIIIIIYILMTPEESYK